jgi:hypothetical protein
MRGATEAARIFQSAPRSAPEPVTAQVPRPVGRPLLTQQWRDLAFLHWPVNPSVAGRRASRFAWASHKGQSVGKIANGCQASRGGSGGWLRLSLALQGFNANGSLLVVALK